MKYFIVAGERSGDLHASKLAEQIYKRDIRAEMVGFGGHYMENAGVTILKYYQSFSFMGIWEVVANLFQIKKTLKDAKMAIKESGVDVVIFVDFPGLNLKLATYAKTLDLKTCFYISPKIWAWKSHRIKRIKRDIDKMLVILPFEVGYYQSKGYEVEYVGNPLTDVIKDYSFDPGFHLDTQKVNIAVLPGSRKQEIEASTKIIHEVAEKKKDYLFHVAVVDNVEDRLYNGYRSVSNLEFHANKTYELLRQSNAAIVTSGTATLETALLNCPQVVVYRANPMSMFIAKLLVKIKWISLVNLIANKGIVKELIQGEYNTGNVLEEIDLILKDPRYCAGMMADYQQLRDRMGTERASGKASEIIIEWLELSNS